MNTPGPSNPQPENTPPASPPAASKLPPSDVWDQVELPRDLAALPSVGEMISEGVPPSTAERPAETKRPNSAGRKSSASSRTADAKDTNFLLLSVQAGPHQGEGRVITAGQSLIVGRGPESHWRLNNELTFSRRQFQIESHSLGWRLVDLHSTNGTFVNGNKVEQVELKHGDRIECGHSIFNVGIADKLVEEDEITVQISMPQATLADSTTDSQAPHRLPPKI